MVKLADTQTSFVHLKCLGIHNHLICDIWNEDCVYYVDAEGCIISVTWCNESASLRQWTIFKVPPTSGAVPHCHKSLSFVSRDKCLLTDGSGGLLIIDTGLRSSQSDCQWQVLQTFQPIPNDPAFTLCASLCHPLTHDTTTHPAGSTSLNIECILLHIVEPHHSSDHYEPNQVHLDWITYVSDSDESKWKEGRVRRLVSTRGPDYISIQPDGGAVCLRGEKPFSFTYDSLYGVTHENPPAEQVSEEPQQPGGYTESDEGEWMHVDFIVSEETRPENVVVALTRETVDVSLTSGRVLLRGALYRPVNVDSSTWSLCDQRLKLSLNKQEASPWPAVTLTDQSPTPPNSVLPEAENGILDHMTSDKWNPDPDPESKPFNTEQLEECDECTDTGAMLQTLDGDTHVTTLQVDCSNNQWLFNSYIHGDINPTMCLRHDVDGIVWRPPTLRDESWSHVATLNAFGYIQASKKPQFCCSSPDHSYAVIAEYTRHVYIYHQPTPITTTLRNRKTGEKVTDVCKQQVLALESGEKILGVQAQNKRLFILTDSNVYAVTLH